MWVQGGRDACLVLEVRDGFLVQGVFLVLEVRDE
jgi:hypothetical protein